MVGSGALVSTTIAAPRFGVGCRTLIKWADAGRLHSVRPSGLAGKRLYDVDAFFSTRSEAEQPDMERCVDVVYARVSTRKQLDDLQSQAGRPAAQHPSARVIRDIGSGLNFKRKGLLSLLDLAFERRLRTVHIAHRDRLCRFAFDLVQHILRKHGAEITVDAHGAEAATLSPESELVEDVLSVVTVFGARIHGRRSAGRRNRQRDSVECALQEGEDFGRFGTDADGGRGAGAAEAQGGEAAASTGGSLAHHEDTDAP